jgi:phosphoribosylamine--glycine ligase
MKLASNIILPLPHIILGMNILVLGSGGREHTLAWKIAQSKDCTRLFIAPGNAGTAQLGTNVNLNLLQFAALGEFCLRQDISLLVVGPEDPLVQGIVDYFKKQAALKRILIIGPNQAAAQLEGSKRFAKEFMQNLGIPTARYQSFNQSKLKEGKAFLKTLTAPYVLKADGLAAGKGVLIIDSLPEAEAELENMLSGKFGKASAEVVIEEFLEGQELSVFALTDGIDYRLLPEAKDYKRVGEGDTGLNTGGMGAISPVAFADDLLMQKIEQKIVAPTIKGLAASNFYYRGFVFFGLMVVKGEPYVIEYNVRLGDPETEVILPRLQSDLVSLLKATAQQKLKEQEVIISNQYASTVMAVSEGYPGSYEKGKVITGLDELTSRSVLPFHAGTRAEGETIETTGGRVICFTGLGSSQNKALEKSYQALKTICFEGITYRKDIGFDLQKNA